MKQRVLVAVIGIPLMLVMLLFLPVWVTGVVVALICSLAAYELLWASGLLKSARILVAAVIMACFTCVWSLHGTPGTAMQLALFLFWIYLCLELLAAKTKLEFSLICVALLAGVGIPYMLSSIIRILMMEHGRYLILAPFVMTMVPDSGAYLVGCRVGKHKLAPAISPNKTIEGMVGGMVTGILAMLLYGFVLQCCGFTVNYLYTAIYGLLGSLCSVAGDLVYSTVKRQRGIKDFGHLLPGHGGALDRFDSTTLAAPLTELLLLMIPMVVIVS